jgi:phage-related protein
MITAADLTEILWQGDARKIARRFPKGARNALGKELTRIQLGLQPRDGKWLNDIGPGVQEIRIAYSKEAYRVIYVARLANCIYILHAFHKKAKKGIATPKEELDLASRRYKDLVKSLRRS